MLGLEPIIIVIGLLPLIVMGIVGTLIFRQYKRCAPNQALIITGLYASSEDQPFKLITSGGAVVLPFVQQLNKLDLEPLPVKAPMSSPIVTSDKTVITVDCSGQVKIQNDPASIARAAENLLSKTKEEIRDLAQEIIDGHTRSVLSSLTVEEVAQSLGKCAQQIQEKSSVDLSKVGLTLLTLQIKDVKDSYGRLYPF